jgi:phosphoribosylanthranilate isomerase
VSDLCLKQTDGSARTLGGTGNAHDWVVSAKIRDAIYPVPLFLAGGLNATNIKEAVTRVRPYGVDLCSSVRTFPTAGNRSHSLLDANKLQQFFNALNSCKL